MEYHPYSPSPVSITISQTCPPSGSSSGSSCATVAKTAGTRSDLSLPARCALIELLDRYNGINNGMIGLSVRTLADALNCSQATATRALRELDDSRLAVAMTPGFWRGKRATEWRIAFYRCDKTGELPNKSWPPREVHQGSAKGSPGKRNGCSQVHLESPNAENPNKRECAQVHQGSTYRIYQGGMDLVTRTSRPGSKGLEESYPELPEFLQRRKV